MMPYDITMPQLSNFFLPNKLSILNSLRPRRNRCHFVDDIFKCIFLNETVRTSLRISLKFVLIVRINSIPALVQTMAWWRPDDKPLSEPMTVRLPMHICVTRPQWVNDAFTVNLTFFYYQSGLLICHGPSITKYLLAQNSMKFHFYIPWSPLWLLMT